MTTPKKPTETGLTRGVSEAMNEIMMDYRLVDNESGWMENAKCRKPNNIHWFPEPGESHFVPQAKKFCGDCPVRERCLRWALTNSIPFGVWGGKSATDRKNLLPNYIKRGIL